VIWVVVILLAYAPKPTQHLIFNLGHANYFVFQHTQNGWIHEQSHTFDTSVLHFWTYDVDQIWIVNERDTVISGVEGEPSREAYRPFPNPAGEFVFVWSDRPGRIDFYAGTGEHISHCSIGSGTNKIRSPKTSGVYFYKISPLGIRGKIVVIR